MAANLTIDVVPDAQIAASVDQAELLLRSLKLTDEERIWAKKQATAIFKTVTDALLDSGKAFTSLRGVCAPAAIAYALSIARDWGAESDRHATSTENGSPLQP